MRTYLTWDLGNWHSAKVVYSQNEVNNDGIDLTTPGHKTRISPKMDKATYIRIAEFMKIDLESYPNLQDIFANLPN